MFRIPETIETKASKIDASKITAMAERASLHLENIRKELLAPYPRKAPPLFKSSHLAQILGGDFDRKKIDYILATQESDIKEGRPPRTSLPNGSREESRKQRQFSVTDVIKWVEQYHPLPTDKRYGKVVAFGNYKGGVAKTTTSVSVAQALTLRGMKVLFIDLDPQGSSTLFMGYAPDAEIEVGQTIIPILYNEADEDYRASLKASVRPTYWHNLDIIAGSSQLAEAEMLIIGKIKSNPGIEFWNLINEALKDLRADYDAIIIDTPPQLSNLTLNALFAADGIIMPLPPEPLDFASSTEFWWLLGEIISGLDPNLKKDFDFVNVVLTKVDYSYALTPTLIEWVKAAYQDAVLPIQIPKSNAIKTASADFATIYDTPTPEGSPEAYRKARAAHDELAQYIFNQITRA